MSKAPSGVVSCSDQIISYRKARPMAGLSCFQCLFFALLLIGHQRQLHPAILLPPGGCFIGCNG